MTDYYSILGVSSAARPREIRRAFRMLQRHAHPDSTKTAATRHISAKLNESYQILSNPLKKLEYDLKHGFKQKTQINLSKLEEYKRRKAKKIRDNLSSSAQRSRDIESNVTSTFSDGKIIKNCGLIITKAKYGLMDMEQRSRAMTLNKRQEICNMPRSVSLTQSITRRSLSNIQYDSEKESVAHVIQKNKHKAAEKEYTIDVTDAIQCIVAHREQHGGYIQIDRNIDKSTLDGFYVPSSIINNPQTRYLEIEYLFNRKYHYTKVNNFEYLCIPNKAHIVHIFDAKDPYKSICEFAEDTEEDQETEIHATEDLEEKTDSVELDTNMPTLTSSIIQQKAHIISMSNEIIELPSGKLARKSRPSLVNLPKFSDIEHEQSRSRNEERIKYETNKRHAYEISDMIKWSVGLMVIGAIGGLSYYLVNKTRNSKQNRSRNEIIRKENEEIVTYWWTPQDSLVLYIQQYWNWIIGMEKNED